MPSKKQTTRAAASAAAPAPAPAPPAEQASQDQAPPPAAEPPAPNLLSTMRAVAEATGEQIESVLAGTEDDEVIVKLKPLGNEKYLQPLTAGLIGAGKALAMLGKESMTEHLREKFSEMREYAAGTHPDQTEDAAVPVLQVAITDLGQARLLPEAPEDHTERPDDVQFAPGSIEQFMDADGRTMRIVNVGGQAHKAPAPFIPEQPTTEEA